jgi:hypothetical protein
MHCELLAALVTPGINDLMVCHCDGQPAELELISISQRFKNSYLFFSQRNMNVNEEATPVITVATGMTVTTLCCHSPV